MKKVYAAYAVAITATKKVSPNVIGTLTALLFLGSLLTLAIKVAS